MKLKRFIKFNESVNLTDSIFKDLEAYLLKNIGASIKNMGLTAQDFDLYCQYYNIGTSEEFLKSFPVKGKIAKDLIEKYFARLEAKPETPVDIEKLKELHRNATELAEKSRLRNINIEMKQDYLSIKIILPKKAKLADLIRISSFLKGVGTKEILGLSELELWKTTKGNSMLSIDYYLSKSDDEYDGYDDDDDDIKWNDIPF